MPSLLYPWALRSWAGGGTDPVASGTVTATAVPATGRVTLAVTWPGAAFVNLYRIQGEDLIPVRGAFPVASGGTVTVADPEAPLDLAVSYLATSPTYPYQQLRTAAPVTLAAAARGGTWLTHPTRPELAMTVQVDAQPAKDRDIDQAVFPVLGRRMPVVLTGGVRRAASFTVQIFTQTEAERLGMLALLDDGAPLLLRTPAGYGFDPLCWVAVGKVTETPWIEYGPEPARYWPLVCQQVDPPSPAGAPVVR